MGWILSSNIPEHACWLLSFVASYAIIWTQDEPEDVENDSEDDEDDEDEEDEEDEDEDEDEGAPPTVCCLTYLNQRVLMSYEYRGLI